MKKRLIMLLTMSLCLGSILTGCGEEETQLPSANNNITEETPEVTIIDDNDGEKVNELLEEDKEKDPVSAELMEESELIIPSEAKDEEKKEEKKKDTPIIDPVTEAVVEPDDIVVDVNNLNGHQENMLMLMDALNMCLMENSYEFDINNTEFFWNAINYTIMNYPEVPGADSEKLLSWAEDYSYIKVHQDLIDVYAEGLFAGYSSLPEVPENCMVEASEEPEYYHLSIGDRGISYGEIVTWVQTSDGSCHVEVRLADAMDDKTIVSYVYELVENTNENAVFAYRIKSAKIKPTIQSVEAAQTNNK